MRPNFLVESVAAFPRAFLVVSTVLQRMRSPSLVHSCAPSRLSRSTRFRTRPKPPCAQEWLDRRPMESGIHHRSSKGTTSELHSSVPLPKFGATYLVSGSKVQQLQVVVQFKHPRTE